MNLRTIAGLLARVARRTQAARRSARRVGEIEDMLRRRPLELSTDRC